MLQCLHAKTFNIKTGVEGSWSFQIIELTRKMPQASGAFNFNFEVKGSLEHSVSSIG